MGSTKSCYCCLVSTLFVLQVIVSSFAPSLADTDTQLLLRFKASLANNSALSNWDESTTICDWTGVLCPKGAFHGLKLESMGLAGVLDFDSLQHLTTLRSFSLVNNNFEGPLPAINKIGRLRALFLSNNKFSGEIPNDAFLGMGNLKKLYLDGNGFTGQIPQSLVDLSTLIELNLGNNHFHDHIPDFHQHFRFFNLANNQLDGPIPDSLSNTNPTSVAGNIGLCGKPLEPCITQKPNTHFNHKAILIVVIVVVLSSSIIVASIIYVRGRRAQDSQSKQSAQKFGAHDKSIDIDPEGLKESQSDYYSGGYKKINDGALKFVREDRQKFDMQELLRASAQVLGSSSFGSSYKATVSNGDPLVVKRFKHMNKVGKQEFYDHMKKLGRLSHPNILPLVAFYYRKEEKLLIYDYADNGSLASHLHARRAPGEAGLDWPTRLKIIKGVARGLAYLYNEFPSEMLPHGHLKSSNVILDQNFEPKLSEYTLVPVISKNHAQQNMAAYKSPEATENDQVTRKTDVWCLGILILELLTGKFPSNYLRHGKGGSADLAAWVNSVVMEEWTVEVFDKDMVKGTKSGEGEMLTLLKIGMNCCEWGWEGRWDWRDAVEKIEELKEKDSDEDCWSYLSECDLSRAMTEEDIPVSLSHQLPPSTNGE